MAQILFLAVDLIEGTQGIRREKFERHYLGKFRGRDGDRVLFLFGLAPENLDQVMVWAQSEKVRVLFARLPQEEVARLQEKVKLYGLQRTGVDSTARLFLSEFKPLVKRLLETYTRVELGEMVIQAKQAQGMQAVA